MTLQQLQEKLLRMWPVFSNPVLVLAASLLAGLALLLCVFLKSLP